MEIRDIYARLGKIDNLEIARASVSKTEALFQIVEYID